MGLEGPATVQEFLAADGDAVALARFGGLVSASGGSGDFLPPLLAAVGAFSAVAEAGWTCNVTTRVASTRQSSLLLCCQAHRRITAVCTHT